MQPLHSMGGMPGLENLSPEEMQMLEQELQAAAQQIDAYVGSLSPEEQAEFQNAVAEVEQMMSSMSEEELGQFFEQIMAAEMEQAQLQGAQPMPIQQPAVTFEQKPTAVASKVILTSAEEKALALLTSLIDSTDKLLLKTDNIPEISRMFEQWTKKNKITATNTNTTWQQQKNNIIELRQHISDLKKTDLKTGKYLFIEAFTKNSILYNQLELLSKQLEINEPRVVVSNFGIEKLSDDAKTALQACLSAYDASLQTTKADIKKLFEEIGPELTKIKEEEKKVTEKAQTEAAKGRTVTPGRTAGSAAGMGDYYGGGRGGYDDYGYDRGGYGKDYGYGDYGRPSQGGLDTKAPKDKDGGRKPQKGGSGKGEDKKDDKFKNKKDKDKGKDKKDAKPSDADKKKATTELVACPADGGEQLNGKYELIASNYRYLEQLLQENSSALDLGKLLKEQQVDPQYALYLFPTIERRLKRLNELVKEYTDMASKTKDIAQKNAALEKLAALDKQQTLLKLFSANLELIVATLQDAEKADDVIRAMPADVRYAYFKNSLKLSNSEEKEALKAPSDITKKEFAQTSVVSLIDIAQELSKLAKAMPEKKPEKPDDKNTEKPAQTAAKKVV